MSAPFVGRDQIYAGIGKETTRGTPVSASKWYPWTAFDFLPKDTKVLDNSAFGVLEENSDAQIIEQWSDGKLEGRIRDVSTGYFLLNLAGTQAVALHSGETTVSDHTFTESQSVIPPSMTFTRKDANLDQQYANGMVGSYEIDITQGKFITFSSSITATVGTSSTDTPAIGAENGFTSKHAVATLASNVAGLSGGTVAVINSMKATLNRNITRWHGAGQNAPYDIYAGKLGITGTITLRYLDSTYMNLDFNNTTNAMLINLLNTDVTIGSASHPQMQLQFNKLSFSAWTPDNQLDKVNEQTLSFTGLLDATTGAGWQAILTNTQTSLY